MCVKEGLTWMSELKNFPAGHCSNHHMKMCWHSTSTYLQWIGMKSCDPASSKSCSLKNTIYPLNLDLTTVLNKFNVFFYYCLNVLTGIISIHSHLVSVSGFKTEPDLVASLTFMRISNLCNQLLWFWKRFSSFQMFSSMSASVDTSPRVCWTIRELSDALVTFSIRNSWRCDETWEWETGKGRKRIRSEGFVLGFVSLIRQLWQRHQSEYHLLSIITVILDWANILMQCRRLFAFTKFV